MFQNVTSEIKTSPLFDLVCTLTRNAHGGPGQAGGTNEIKRIKQSWALLKLLHNNLNN